MDHNFKTITLPLGILLLTTMLALGVLIGYSYSLLRADIAELRADVRGDISALRSEVTAMRGELAGTR